MRLSELKEDDKQLDEFLPALGAVGSAIATGARAVGGALATGAKAVGGAALGAAKAGAQAVGQAAGQAASGIAGIDPAQAAMAAKEQLEQKKQLQDQIKQAELQLTDLRKQLAELG